jgi:pimeloyl-ACP methyl ester carboxylesterase
MHTVVSADGTEIGYERHGSGQPLLCIHGTGVTRRIWLPLVSELVDDATCLVPDRRGRGASGDAAEYDFERELGDMRAVADTTSMPVLFGSSFGGLLALRLAERLPVAGLILYEPPMPAVTVDEAYESLAGRMEELLAAGERERAVKLFFEEAAGARTVEQWPIWPDCVDLAETIIRESAVVESFRPGDPDIDVPVCLLTGERSLPNLRASIDVLEGLLSDTRRVELDGVGHAGMAVVPTQIAAAVREFL